MRDPRVCGVCVCEGVSEKLPDSMGTHNADQMPTADEQTDRRTDEQTGDTRQLKIGYR